MLLENFRMACWPSKCSACFLGCSWVLSREGRASAGYLNPGLHSHPAALTYPGTAREDSGTPYPWIFLTCLTQSSNAEQGLGEGDAMNAFSCSKIWLGMNPEHSHAPGLHAIPSAPLFYYAVL